MDAHASRGQRLASSAQMIELVLRQMFRGVATLLVVVAPSVVLGSAQAVRTQQSSGIEARVSKVLDGDTFTLCGESRRIRV